MTEDERPFSIEGDGSRRVIHPADVSGRFVRARMWLYAVLIAFYLALPFLRVGGHPAIHLDIPARRFHLIGLAFNAQDVWRLVFLILAIGFALLFVTAWLGRVWCGWACPQTVFMEGIYRRIERLIDGPRKQRMARMGTRWTGSRIARAIAKHALFTVVSLVFAHALVAVFVPLPDLLAMVRHGPKGQEVVFGWAVGFTLVTQINFAWFREQVCLVVCPYGRYQSAMSDEHSLIVGYDRVRGEPRGKLRRKLPVVSDKGDCIDCHECVRVCPTGIDIRNGLQMECIACAQCIDACDDVMTKVKRPIGLIRYDSSEGLEGKPRKVLRPRLFLYGGFFSVAVGALGFTSITRTPFEANVVRPASTPYVLDKDVVRDLFELHVVNKNSAPSTFHVKVETEQGATVAIPSTELHLGSFEHARLPIFVSMPIDAYRVPFEVKVVVSDDLSGHTKIATGRFIGPPR